MANLNIELPDELHKRLKLSAVMSDRTLKEHIIGILEEAAKQERRR